MIPRAVIQAWSVDRPWPTLVAVEQDLVLARLIVELANHPLLGNELVFRGGTCLHQLVLPQPRRYSEDLDFVRSTHTPVGPLFDAIREIASTIGLEVAGTQISEHPKIRLRATSETDAGAVLRIKVELNTHETSPALPTIRMPFTVETAWFTGSADVLTFSPAELFATKIRALYQRRKGRDLFDMWLGLTELQLLGAQIVGAFGPYRPEGLTAHLAEENLKEKLQNAQFRTDLDALVSGWPAAYDIDQAAALVVRDVLRLL